MWPIFIAAVVFALFVAPAIVVEPVAPWEHDR